MNKNLGKWTLPLDCVVGACAEVLMTEKEVSLRTTGNPKTVVKATKQEWLAFIEAAKKGQYDY